MPPLRPLRPGAPRAGGDPRLIAVYRLLYGSDFIAESLESIYPHVEQILCFVGREMFGGRRVVSYFGRDVYLPHDIDGVTDAIRAFIAERDREGKIQIIDNPYCTVLKNQMGMILNHLVLPHHDCTHVFMVEADEVWREDRLQALIDLAARSDADEIMAAGVDLFWRSPKFVSERTNPYCVLRRVEGRRQIGPTGHALASAADDVTRATDPAIRVHNFGYAASERTVFWKHMTGLSFSRDLGWDSVPREEWFEDVWRAWNWHTNRREDICPSKNHPNAFAPAKPYPIESLPEPIRRRMLTRPLTEWAAAERSPARTTAGDARCHLHRQPTRLSA